MFVYVGDEATSVTTLQAKEVGTSAEFSARKVWATLSFERQRAYTIPRTSSWRQKKYERKASKEEPKMESQI